MLEPVVVGAVEYRLVAVVPRANAEAAVPAEPPLRPLGVLAEVVMMFTLADPAGVHVPDSVTVAVFVLAVIWNPLVSFDDTVRPLVVVPVGVPLDGSMAVEMVLSPVEAIATALATVNVTFCVALVAASDTCAPSNVAASTVPAIQANLRFIYEPILCWVCSVVRHTAVAPAIRQSRRL